MGPIVALAACSERSAAAAGADAGATTPLDAARGRRLYAAAPPTDAGLSASAECARPLHSCPTAPAQKEVRIGGCIAGSVGITGVTFNNSKMRAYVHAPVLMRLRMCANFLARMARSEAFKVPIAGQLLRLLSQLYMGMCTERMYSHRHTRLLHLVLGCVP